ncbi:hypothetical protein RVR_4501 [Actinacidiphila reveromycinica]|uniref:Uncharacterized protein n=1 Tax=Actinacidiphila reveromycinica TaxID=659352 RepID=A0A7U3VP64_9ACTN|nr:hypothetical protein [Streptomyces sp. SN-593]BBA98353.1 hypothetical protein RVR_4501 [Streptomyces sp. SN-593]
MPVEPIPCAPGGGGDPGTSCCAPSIASVPLCREDGTPLLLVLRSACACDGAEAAPPEVAGWIDPTTGAFTDGPPPAGAVPCGSDGREDCSTVSLLRLCDQADGGCVPFLRHLVHDCDGIVTTSTDTAEDGITPYTPVGQVVDCQVCEEQCQPTVLCPQLLGISGPDSWSMPEGTESVAVTVACGPVTITDCAGNATVVNECGTAFQWAAPPSGCQPGALCAPFTVDLPEGAAVYINFLSPCDQDGDVS